MPPLALASTEAVFALTQTLPELEGATVSNAGTVTVTVKVQVAELEVASVAVAVTVVTPALNVEPEPGEKAMLPPAQLSVIDAE